MLVIIIIIIIVLYSASANKWASVRNIFSSIILVLLVWADLTSTLLAEWDLIEWLQDRMEHIQLLFEVHC